MRRGFALPVLFIKQRRVAIHATEADSQESECVQQQQDILLEANLSLHWSSSHTIPIPKGPRSLLTKLCQGNVWGVILGILTLKPSRIDRSILGHSQMGLIQQDVLTCCTKQCLQQHFRFSFIYSKNKNITMGVSSKITKFISASTGMSISSALEFRLMHLWLPDFHCIRPRRPIGRETQL